MKKAIKIILILGLVTLIIFLVVGRQSKTRSDDVIDLENDLVTENESTVSNLNIANREMVQVKFSWEVNGIKYNDALNITKEEYDKLNEEDIKKMKEERFVNWAKTVNAGSKQE
ncbi:MAG: hypothetical protein A3A96_00845 [Candidatus Zambryskibacteria bacterium RIFCSPLOWO2_01_FULL_39_39]|uniref:Uncharacterized protein n=1 Tax=Candidatus Zambryskibacteria bacterium RIFCSPLOWO2_01_FULL_39_39 TaxID=1802758 RepID=A0A1G2TYM3_9BACT|nr:MAG: hypothetical protein UT00_C0001G0103 [Parcubacteria group bacterium GW2011_GWA1_38_7]OHA95108.1 MAG: hypothetical protein A3B88_03445 [Candidatus Zambryskibacteria bacterium RIFCSPHIGHO2_02_FULL_39_19]OHA98228.1 MAG: hypothetical protein A3F20_04260 [Candidatus Zambryskibacteria bacterium RIFCSPHIGHO2_12_FULL_39_21]OHB02406.1 MAG: hypothetical protein A3A96_00845 [Candidatus Zambryskibacteria bacterium RIFCSPLOWO2_01_FULL_39_39]